MILLTGGRMKWFFQHPNYQLGDFIMMTPGLKAISEIDGAPIPIFFGTPYIALLYQKCPFLSYLPVKPRSNKAFMGTQFSSYNPTHYYKTRSSKKESMSECFFRRFSQKNGYKGEIPNTYIDTNITHILNKEDGKKYVAVFHGCLGDEFISKKSIKTAHLQEIINAIVEKGRVPVILGNKLDYKRFWKCVDLSHPSIINYLNKTDIKDSASILSQCDCFISNDTGLYHVAGALQMKGLVFWGTTDFCKNRVVFNGIQRVMMSKVKSFKKRVEDYL